nr:inositol oxygenase [Columba livia]
MLRTVTGAFGVLGGVRLCGRDPDPCDGPEPSKAKAEYRNYTDGKLLDRVYNTYLQMHTHPDWFHLVGLLHDLGKVLVLFGEPQWAVVGDTFPVGCKVQKSVVFGDSTFHNNPDTRDPRYSTEFGMYQPHCGLENVLMSWGHDGKGHRARPRVPSLSPCPQAFYMVRFHSFYPWHAHGDYRHLCSEQDLQMLPWVQELNKFDLYTKVSQGVWNVKGFI